MVSFGKYIASFAVLLDNIDVKTITNNTYAANYLNHLIENRYYYLSIYADVLDKAVSNIKPDYKQETLLDFGCGNGLLALFAKYVGFKNVFACDVSQPFLLAAEALGHKLEIIIDGWILGTESQVVQQLGNQKITIWIGTDVIEHVYSIPNLLETIKANNPEMVTIFSTASVYENPFKRKSLQKLMLRDELTDSDASQSSNERFAGVPFLQVRKAVIEEAFPSMNKNEIHILAKQTRGLKKEDILETIRNHYLTNKRIPYSPPDTYNTCDPLSGSFTERLLPIGTYKNIYNKHGYGLTVYNGFYNGTAQTTKAILLKLANQLIKLLGKKGMIISPYIILVGKPLGE